MVKSQNSGQLSVWNHDPCIKLGWCRLPRAFPSLLGHIPSCSALSTTVPQSRTPSTPLDTSGSPKWRCGSVSQLDGFVSMPLSFIPPLWRSGGLRTLPWTTVLLPSSSGLSPGLPGECCRVLSFEHSRTCSNAFCSFVSFSLVSLAHPDARDASASPHGSPSST